MRHHRLPIVLLAAAGLVIAGDGQDPADSRANPMVPRVLRDSEPADSLVVRLPGAPVRVPAVQPAAVPPVVPQTVAKAEEPSLPHDPPSASVDLERPILRRAPKPVYPQDFEKNSAMYCQKLIGSWSLEDAGMLLGEPRGARPAFDDKHRESGNIYAYSDPTGRYRQLELDFDGTTGVLRTVFGYPWSLSWQECRRQWGGNVSSAFANKGRKFYSYLNRRLDVLVDQGGKVISLGLY